MSPSAPGFTFVVDGEIVNLDGASTIVTGNDCVAFPYCTVILSSPAFTALNVRPEPVKVAFRRSHLKLTVVHLSTDYKRHRVHDSLLKDTFEPTSIVPT